MHGIKKFIIQSIALLILTTAAFYVYLSYGGGLLPVSPQTDNKKQLQINNTIFKVDIADNQNKKSKGLAERENLASDEGMLFVYENPDRYSYWMKGLNFPLDFIWIREDKVVDLLTNIPPPAKGQKDETLPIYKPVTAVDKVLEVTGGTIDRLQIKIGDTVKLVD